MPDRFLSDNDHSAWIGHRRWVHERDVITGASPALLEGDHGARCCGDPGDCAALDCGSTRHAGTHPPPPAPDGVAQGEHTPPPTKAVPSLPAKSLPESLSNG